MKLNRKITRRLQLKDNLDDGYVPAEMSERISMVWEITCDVWSFVKGQDAEQRLQRNVTALIRRGS
jgi:hypothetical protein